MNNSLNWDHLRYFVAVVNMGSVVGAARNLGVSHATVLRNISQLENGLRLRLFDRRQAGYRVTAQGEEIFVNAVAMEEQAETLMRRAMGQDPAPEGLLKLAVSDASLIDLFPVLREFRREYPGIELSIGPVRRLGEDILHRKVDVAMVATNTPPDDLVGRQLARVNFACYASSEYLQEKLDPAAPEECEWITWSLNGLGDLELDSSFQNGMFFRLVPNQNVALHAINHGDAVAAVRAGVGVSLLRKYSFDELVELSFRAPSESLGIWMLTHPDLRRSGRVRVFMDFVADNFLPIVSPNARA